MQLINAKNEHGAVVPFSEEVLPFMRIFANSAAIALERARAQMEKAMHLRLISMLELRHGHAPGDGETAAHRNRVAAYTAEIYETWARRRAMDQKTIAHDKELVRIAAMLHDIGKVGIKDEILRKPGPLTPEEHEALKQHTVKGASFFIDPQSEFDRIAGEIALNHHERWDGTGYPGGKQGETIPLFARLVAIADVYDELIFREGFEEADAAATVKRGGGTRFDPEMIEAFEACFDIIRQGFPNEDA